MPDALNCAKACVSTHWLAYASLFIRGEHCVRVVHKVLCVALKICKVHSLAWDDRLVS